MQHLGAARDSEACLHFVIRNVLWLPRRISLLFKTLDSLAARYIIPRSSTPHSAVTTLGTTSLLPSCSSENTRASGSFSLLRVSCRYNENKISYICSYPLKRKLRPNRGNWNLANRLHLHWQNRYVPQKWICTRTSCLHRRDRPHWRLSQIKALGHLPH